WITEVGWPANGWNLNPNLQADYLAQTYALLLSSGLTERIFAYSFKDQSPAPLDTWGMVSWGNGPTDLSTRRPAFSAYATSAHLLTDTSPGGRIQLSTLTPILDFDLNSKLTTQNSPLSSGPWSHSIQGTGSLTIS